MKKNKIKDSEQDIEQNTELSMGIALLVLTVGFIMFLINAVILLLKVALFFLPILLFFVHPFLGITAGLVYTYLAIVSFAALVNESNNHLIE